MWSKFVSEACGHSIFYESRDVNPTFLSFIGEVACQAAREYQKEAVSTLRVKVSNNGSYKNIIFEFSSSF